MAELAHWTSGSQRVVREAISQWFGGEGSVARNLKFACYFDETFIDETVSVLYKDSVRTAL